MTTYSKNISDSTYNITEVDGIWYLQKLPTYGKKKLFSESSPEEWNKACEELIKFVETLKTK